MKITISKQEVFKEVEKRTSLEGYVLSDRYDNILADENRGELLNSYWIESCTAIVQLMKRYLSGQTVSHSLNTYNSNETFEINVTMPDRYDSNLDGSVTTDIKMLMACNIATGWLKVVSPESATKYQEEGKGYSDDLISKLLFRIEPTSNFTSAAADAKQIFETEQKPSSAKADEYVIGKSETDLSSAKEDDDRIYLSEESLSSAKGDEEVISKTESDLSSAKGDEEVVHLVEEALKPAKLDEVVLEQKWGKCNP